MPIGNSSTEIFYCSFETINSDYVFPWIVTNIIGGTKLRVLRISRLDSILPQTIYKGISCFPPPPLFMLLCCDSPTITSSVSSLLFVIGITSR